MKPALFSELTFEAAKAKAKADGKWLLLDFTAEWCAPCKQMDETAWRDSAVVQWIMEHAIAIQIDVDKDITAKKFEVRSMPTFVVLKDDKELDRSSGARSGTKLLQWLEAVKAGGTEIDALREAAKVDLQAKIHLARVLAGRGKHDDAAREALWLWDNGLEVEPGFVGVRLSYLIGLFRELIDASPLLKTELTKRRDALLPKLTTTDAIRDFTALNEALEDPQSTLTWFDAVKDRSKELELDEDRGLKETLQQEGRWADLGKIAHEPVRKIQESFDLAKEVLSDLPRGMNPEAVIDGFRGEAAMLVFALQEAGRTEDEAAVRAKAVELDPSEEMKQALDNGIEG